MPRLSGTIRLNHWYDYYSMGGGARGRKIDSREKEIMEELRMKEKKNANRKTRREMFEKLREANELPDQCPIDD